MRALLILTLFAAGLAYSAPATPAAVGQEFEEMKALVGTWEGSSTMDGKDVPVKVVYELTSGGNAVTSKLMPGTPHEMLSVYYKNGKSIAMTHYCAAGNQPRMLLNKNDGKTMVFAMNKLDGIQSAHEVHMHQMSLTKVDQDTIREEWVAFKDGKAQAPHVFNFKRVKQ